MTPRTMLFPFRIFSTAKHNRILLLLAARKDPPESLVDFLRSPTLKLGVEMLRTVTCPSLALPM